MANQRVDGVSDDDLAEAEERGHALIKNGPRAASVRYETSLRRIVVELTNTCVYAFPVDLVEDLRGANDAALAEVIVDGMGFNLHWPQLDVDLLVPALIAGIFGTRVWTMREMARQAGQVRSPAKAAAAKTNGAKGGRPRKIALR